MSKVLIIIAISLLLIGSIVFCGVMVNLNWDFTKLSTDKYQANDYNISEAYKNISIITNTADVTVVPSSSQKSQVSCLENEKAKHTVEVKDGTLVIKINDNRKWYDHIDIFTKTPKITLSIPQGEYGTLSVKLDTGDVNLPKDFNFKSVDIVSSTGDVSSLASTTDYTKIKTSTGDISVEGISAKALELSSSTGDITANNIRLDEDFKTKVSTGKVTLTDITCKNVISNGDTGNILLNNVIAKEKFVIERTTGDVKLDKSDAGEIYIETDTGDVTGTLLNEKIFIVKTDTGRIDLPKTVNGGRCEITTDTGDISIKIN